MSMEPLNAILAKLKVSTSDVEQEILQEVIYVSKKHISAKHTQIFNEIVDNLWNHLCNGFVEFDNQLLCATSFFSILMKSDKKYLNRISNTIDIVILSRSDDLSKKNELSLAVSLIYGMFQSPYLQNNLENQDEMETLLNLTLDLLISLAYDYSQYTFIVFKTMTCFKKVIGIDLERTIFSEKNKTKLLNIVNHNWESPITGVRNMNRSIFRTLISILDCNSYNLLLDEINMFYWSKAKFLMLTEIIEEYNGDIEELVIRNKWISGLTFSLSKTGLVSAGADMYYAILKKIKSHEIWISMFSKDVIQILCCETSKSLENYYNYWCLSTIKKFPQLFDIIVQQVQCCNGLELHLYSLLFLLKQGNKIGIFHKNWKHFQDNQILTKILNSTEHSDPNIRSLSFEIICVSHNKELPTQVEFSEVLDFLWNNVNSDCTLLRLSMLNSLNNFMSKLHAIFMNSIRKLNENEIIQLQDFFKKIQILIKKSLNLDGNYQRRITTVKILDILLKHAFEKTRKKDKNTIDKTLCEFLNDKKVWILNHEDFVLKLKSLLKDPANDVHECVSLILFNYYSEHLSEPCRLNTYIDDGKKCLSSKFFYEITCGHIIFKLVTNILIKYEINATFKSVQDIHNFAYDELHKNYKTNTLELIENGKQLHSFINLLSVIFEACIKYSYNLNISTDTLLNLLEILNYISNQFALENQTLSSDFSKMNDMVQEIITEAGYNPEDEYDKSKISGRHQLVLNCLWLNLKSSCELSSLIIRCNLENFQVCAQCLNGITNVLETSRHKGAIEAAGTALGNSIKYLTSQPKNYDASKLPLQLLEKKLQEWISPQEHNRTASITRRGAGLSIMIHKIVANDMQKGKPLFHHVMKILLSACKCDINDSISGNEKDLPKAIYIHFLTKIVMDSSLSSDTMFYATALAEIVFENLTDTHWQIRNAALQLYGALVPKLIGQKKASDMSEETAATVACDELRTHFSKLWIYIAQTVKKTGDDIQSHSNLVPILNILANFAKRYNFSNDHDKNVELLTKSLIRFLGSKLHIVRRLTAKAITNLNSVKILDVVNFKENMPENLLHGVLLLIKCSHNVEFNEKHLDIVTKLIDTRTKHSYLSRLLSEKILGTKYTNTLQILEETVNTLDRNRYEPGIFLWANARIEKVIKEVCWNDMAEILKLLLKFDNIEQHLAILCERIKNDKTITHETSKDIIQILFQNMHNKYVICAVWQTLYQISLQYSMKEYINNFLDMFNKCDDLYRNRYLIPLVARELAKSANNQNLLSVCKVINKLSNPESTDVDLRQISVIANNELANEFSNLTDEVKIHAVETTVILLQDEDEDIRNTSVDFYKLVMCRNETYHPYICLNKILDITFMKYVFKDYHSSVKTICNDLLKFTNLLKLQSSDEFNPFANNSKNIYLEVNLLEDLTHSLLKENEKHTCIS